MYDGKEVKRNFERAFHVYIDSFMCMLYRGVRNHVQQARKAQRNEHKLNLHRVKKTFFDFPLKKQFEKRDSSKVSKHFYLHLKRTKVLGEINTHSVVYNMDDVALLEHWEKPVTFVAAPHFLLISHIACSQTTN